MGASGHDHGVTMPDESLVYGFDADDFGSPGDGYLPVADGTVVGSDESAFWQDQEVNGLCASTSAAMVISEFAGRFVAKDDVAQVAAQHGLLTAGPDGWNGMTADETEQLLELYGIACHVEQGDLDTLSGYLADNRGVILAVDSGEIWGEERGDPDGPAADHALLVTAIDFGRGVAVLNDPGEPGGAGREVSLDVLRDAWADSGNLMVVTDSAPAAVAGDKSGWVILPVALATDDGPAGQPMTPPRLEFGGGAID
jgi:hypothetical protein